MNIESHVSDTENIPPFQVPKTKTNFVRNSNEKGVSNIYFVRPCSQAPGKDSSWPR